MADKGVEGKKQSKLPGILAIAAIIILVIVAVVYYLSTASNFGKDSKTQVVPEAATTTEKKPATEDPAKIEEEVGPYKGWGKLDNKDWGVYARYPTGWTSNETAGIPSVTFTGPPTPAGGVILNECTFSIFVEDVSSAIGLEAYVTAARTTPQGSGDITSQIDTTVDGNEAIQIVDTYVDVGQPWKRLRAWTIKNNRAYTFTFAASPNYNAVNYYTMHESEAEQIMDSILIK